MAQRTTPPSLSPFLNSIFDTYHHPKYFESDPIDFVHHYSDYHNQELVAILSSLLAYGNVKQIRRSVSNLLERLSRIPQEREANAPSSLIWQWDSPSIQTQVKKELNGFVHRFNRDEDLLELFRLIHLSWKRFGSVGKHFSSHLSTDDATIERPLALFIQDWRSWSSSAKLKSSFGYLLTSPADGSCCKRWCMLLRWMGRKDEIDPGLWQTPEGGQKLNPAQLIIPLDTHVGRIARYLGLTDRLTLNWKTALEVTANLKKLDPADPTRYDFALARLGILDLCSRKYQKEVCQKCQLLQVCRYAQSQEGSSPGRLRSTRA